MQNPLLNISCVGFFYFFVFWKVFSILGWVSIRPVCRLGSPHTSFFFQNLNFGFSNFGFFCVVFCLTRYKTTRKTKIWKTKIFQKTKVRRIFWQICDDLLGGHNFLCSWPIILLVSELVSIWFDLLFSNSELKFDENLLRSTCFCRGHFLGR